MGKPSGAAVTERMKKAIHVVSAWTGELSLVPGQEKVEEKTNEIKAIPELLEKLAIEGCTVTIEAMGTQKKIAGRIIDKKADYILQVKGNTEKGNVPKEEKIWKMTGCILKICAMTTGALKQGNIT